MRTTKTTKADNTFTFMKGLILLLLLPLNVTAATVLVVGDSHSVGPFGWALDQHLREAGHSVVTYASCGSIPQWWVTGQKTTCGFFSRDAHGKRRSLSSSHTPLIDDLLRDVRPDVVMIEFGGNYLQAPNDAFVKNDIRRFVQKVTSAGASCFWITPPDSRHLRAEIPRVIRLIKEAVGADCPIFESQLITHYPPAGGDGTHYWSPTLSHMATSWATNAFEAFQAQRK